MFSFSKDDIKPEHLDTAYKYLKEYCDSKNVDVIEFVKNKDNIPEAAKEINKGLPWLVKKVLTVSKIETMLHDNIDFIIKTAEEKTTQAKTSKLKA